MSAFEYVALDVAGRTREGVIKAADEGAARAQLQRRRLAPLKLAPLAAAARAEKSAPVRARGKLSRRALTLITRQIATLASVAPLEEALRTVAAQSERPQARRILFSVHGGVVGGQSLSDAMGRSGDSFPPLYRALVAAGEASGALPAILERLADQLENEQQVQGKVVSALVYPLVLAVVAVLVVAALMVFVVPRVVDQFDTLGQDLPLLTRLVIGASDLMQAIGLPALVALVLGAVAFARAMQVDAFRLRVDRAVVATPLVGRLVRDLHAAQLARTLATMIASGLPVLEGLLITARTVRNQVLKQATESMAAAIREGGSLSAAMRRTSVFPPLLVYMTASGENSGRLEVMLTRAADYLEREFDTATAVALSLLEPVIIVVMGGVVATIVLSILLPILQINSLAFG